MKRKRVCLVSLYSYPLFNPSCEGSFGGSEVRASIIARGLARHPDFEVSLVVFDHGQPEKERIDNVTLYAWRGLKDPGLESHPRGSSQRLGALLKRLFRAVAWRLEWIHAHRLVYWPSAYWRRWLRRILGSLIVSPPYQKIEADLYLIPGNNEMTAEVAFFGAGSHRRSILLAGSDMDYDPAYRLDLDGRNVYGTPHHLMAYAIGAVDAHIVQSEQQAEMLAANYGRQSYVVRNPIDLTTRIDKGVSAMRDVLWVGKSDQVKRPELLLEMARRLPNLLFTMIMTSADRSIHDSILEKARGLDNVTIVEYVPFAEVERYFVRHRLLVNTSTIEGFPNTFLQSMKYGHPVVTLQVDPESIIARHGCGVCASGDLGGLVDLTAELLCQADRYDELAGNCQRYVQDFHDRELIVAQYAEIIGAVIGDQAHGRD
jgi:glycosyltransferase involved in cell wall biosynthesis